MPGGCVAGPGSKPAIPRKSRFHASLSGRYIVAIVPGVVTSRNSQGTVPSRDGVQQAYLCLGTMFHARNPTQTDST